MCLFPLKDIRKLLKYIICQRVPHAYTTPSSPDSARCWVPCLDNLWEKSTWEFEFIVPKSLEDDTDVIDMDGEDGVAENDGHPTVVVCSGELVEKVNFALWPLSL